MCAGWVERRERGGGGEVAKWQHLVGWGVGMRVQREAPGGGDHARVLEGARGGGGWPESLVELAGAKGGAERNWVAWGALG